MIRYELGKVAGEAPHRVGLKLATRLGIRTRNYSF